MYPPFDSSVPGIASEVSILLVLYTFAVVLRFYARSRQDARLGMDDWLVIPGLIAFYCLTAAAIYGMLWGYIGHPTPNDPAIKAAAVSVQLKTYLSTDCITIVGVGCTRLSALFFYRRIFITQRREAFSIITILFMGIVILWMVAYLAFSLLECGTGDSSSDYYNLMFETATSDPRCVTYKLLQSLAITSFILDIMVVFLPIPKIWRLHTSAKRRFGLSAVFLMAGAGCAASCARMVIYIMLVAAGAAHNKIDSFVANSHAYYYTVLECGLTGIAVNLPSLWYYLSGSRATNLLRRVKSAISSRSSSKNVSKNSSNETSSQYTEKATNEPVSRQISLGTTNDHGIPSRRDQMEHTEPPPPAATYHPAERMIENWEPQAL